MFVFFSYNSVTKGNKDLKHLNEMNVYNFIIWSLMAANCDSPRSAMTAVAQQGAAFGPWSRWSLGVNEDIINVRCFIPVDWQTNM